MVVAVDFDGTLTEDGFYPNCGKPIYKNIEYVKELKATGNKIILWTCREKESLQKAVNWCKDFGLDFAAVNENIDPEIKIEQFGYSCRKVYADIYLDDKAMKAYTI